MVKRSSIKTILFTIMALLFTFSLASANPYVSFKGGLNLLDDEYRGAGSKISEDYDAGFGINGAVGWRFGDIGDGNAFRVEAEGLHSENDVSSRSLLKQVKVSVPCAGHPHKKLCDETRTVKSAMRAGDNRRYDDLFFNGYFDFPVSTSLEGYIGGGYSIEEAFQIIGGAMYKISPAIGATAEYRHIRNSSEDYETNAVLFGVRYSF